MTDVNIIENFLSYLLNHKKISSNTLSAYRRDLNSYFDFLLLKKSDCFNASNIELSAFKDFLVDSGKSNSTVSRYMSAIRSFYKYLSVSGLRSDNPAISIKNDKSEKKFFQILSEDEVDRLLAVPDLNDLKGKRDKAMLETLYATGMKVSELMSLNVSDVNLKLHCINCHASSSIKGRVVVLYPKAVKSLEDYINHSRNFFVTNPYENALFVNVNGERMTRQGFWKLLKAYADVARINKSITPHTLRHSFATHLLENGADINDIKNILGHADISSTNVYTEFIKSKTDASYLKFNHRSK